MICPLWQRRRCYGRKEDSKEIDDLLFLLFEEKQIFCNGYSVLVNVGGRLNDG
jgi:hypothetical protein